MAVDTQRVSFVGTLPGPTNGMTLSSLQLVEQLEAATEVRQYDIGRGFTAQGTKWRVLKLTRSILAAFAILSWRPNKGEVLFIQGNSTAGLLYNALHAACGRVRGFRCVFHHHVYSYIDESDWRLRVLLFALGSDAHHVVACSQMSRELGEQYNRSLVSSTLIPSTVPALGARTPVTRPFTIGHLSNLSKAKGTLDAIGVFEALVARGDDVQMIAAGPTRDAAVQAELDRLAVDHPDRFEHRGAVFGDEKQRFFDDIDVFVFPTKNESWGIVANEALAAGVPVISTNAGCLGSMVGDAGVVIDRGVDFVPLATGQIGTWLEDPALHADASARATRRAGELETAAVAAADELITFLSTGVEA